MVPTPLKILSLDGGGVRGLSPLYILKALMEELQKRSNSPNIPRPCEVFDVICGTSTGGLIALMLGRLRMSVDEAIKCYKDLSKDVFGKTRSFPGLGMLIGRSMYDASILEKGVKEIVARYEQDNSDALLMDVRAREHVCHTFVSTCRKSANGVPQFFRSYSLNKGEDDTCKIWEAARATTAISPIFDSIKVGPETFIVRHPNVRLLPE